MGRFNDTKRWNGIANDARYKGPGEENERKVIKFSLLKGESHQGKLSYSFKDS